MVNEEGYLEEWHGKCYHSIRMGKSYSELVRDREEMKLLQVRAIHPTHKKMIENKLTEIREGIKQHVKEHNKNRI